jgi:hypothetical protein
MSKLSASYRDTAVEHFARLSTEIEENTSIEDIIKIETLIAAFQSISGALNRLTERAPSNAPELWEYRENKNENAFEFTRRVYEKYLERGLSKHDIRALDFKLYNAIIDRERRYTDKSLVLLTKKAANDKLLAELEGSLSLANITDLLPGIFRDRLRLYRTATARRHYKKLAAK